MQEQHIEQRDQRLLLNVSPFFHWSKSTGQSPTTSATVVKWMLT